MEKYINLCLPLLLKCGNCLFKSFPHSAVKPNTIKTQYTPYMMFYTDQISMLITGVDKDPTGPLLPMARGPCLCHVPAKRAR